MEIDGSTVIVTGGASGIGRALAQGFAAGGARVVIGDIDEGGAQATAATVRDNDGSAVALRANAADTGDIEALITLASQEFGPVDIFVANAGVIGAPDLGTEADWDRILDINLRAHVRAANLIVPHWRSRGRGHFVAVASAAGLLTQIGAAGYAVSKHAAVGFAEWLSITYGDDGIGVSCVCPLGVDTPLLHAIQSGADAGTRAAVEAVVRSGTVLGADEVAAATIDAVRDGRFLVLPHPQVLDMYRHKSSDYDRWLAGMRRYQRSLDT